MATSKPSFSKNEKEKKRLKQKQEKRQKMEDRKSVKRDGNSLEGMMAYIDENGNISDTPPDPSKKKEFNQEDIEVSVPKHERQKLSFQTGKVAFFNHAKGFGFINDLQTQERIFFHVKDVEGDLEEQDKVQYMVDKGPRGLSASQVSKIN